MLTSEQLFAEAEITRQGLMVRICDAIERRDGANADIKILRAELDKLPVAKTRRAKKAKAEQLTFAETVRVPVTVHLNTPMQEGVIRRVVDPSGEFSGEKLDAKLDALATGQTMLIRDDV